MMIIRGPDEKTAHMNLTIQVMGVRYQEYHMAERKSNTHRSSQLIFTEHLLHAKHTLVLGID